MSFHLRQRESIRNGLRRLAKRELRSAAENLNQQVRSDSSIHEARKSIKKVRTIVQIVEADEASGLAKARKRLRASWLKATFFPKATANCFNS